MRRTSARSSRRPARRPLRSPTSARAAIQIESFETTSSSSLAGDHPDLSTDFELGDSGHRKSPKPSSSTPRRGSSAIPTSSTLAPRSTSRSSNARRNSQSGLITIRADYEGDSEHLLGTVPIYTVEPGADDAARFAFYVPILDIPISIPVSVRSGDRLRPAVHRLRHHPAGPADEGRHDLLGLPVIAGTQHGTVRESLGGRPGRLPRARRHQLHHRTRRPPPSRLRRSPATRRSAVGR